MIGTLPPGDAYRAVHCALFKIDERHDTHRARPAVNDNGWHPLGPGAA